MDDYIKRSYSKNHWCFCRFCPINAKKIKISFQYLNF